MSATIAPVDISNVKTENELDQYLGKHVTFRGKWILAKDSGMTNGLESILLNKVEFEDVPLREILNSLMQKSKEEKHS